MNFKSICQLQILAITVILLYTSCRQTGNETAILLYEMSVNDVPELGAELELSKTEQKKLAQLQKDLKNLSRKISPQLNLRSQMVDKEQAIGLLLLKLGMFNEALEHFNAAIEIIGNNSALFYYRGLAQASIMKSKDLNSERDELLERAENNYQRAIELNPKNLKALYALAILTSFELEDYYRTIRIAQNYLDVRKLSRTRIAGDKKYKSSSSRDVKLLFVMARAQAALGNKNKAAEYYDWIERISISKNIQSQAIQLKGEVLSG